MAKKCPKCAAGAPLWMTTYGDMITLMLCFFIALLAFSSISPGKFQEVASGIVRIFSGKPPSVLMGGKTTVSQPIITSNPGIKEDLLNLTREEDIKGKITVEETDKGTLITLGNMIYFEPFSALLTVEAKALLEKIGTIVVEHTVNVIEVFGYTDDRRPPVSSIYPSNWHLSASRGASVVRYFLEDLKAKRTAELIVEIRNGRFDPDYYYDQNRFYPIGKSDVDINNDIFQLDGKYKSEIDLLNYKLRDGEITQTQAQGSLQGLEQQYRNELEKIRSSYQKITILIKRETTR